MKVSNMESNNGNPVSNQFIIETDQGDYFQSYKSMIAFKPKKGKVQLDKTYWNYSRTTARYRNKFLSDTTQGCVSKIKSGKYQLKNLNK